MSDVGVLISLDEQSTEKSQPVLDYTSRDFVAIRSQLIGLAKGLMPEWEPAGEPSDFGTLLLELFAYMGDVMHFYIDRTASEAFLSTAVRRTSVLYIADMLGYRPIGQQSASVELVFSLDTNSTENVTLDAGTRVHNSADNADNLIVFELDMPVTLEARDPTAEEAAEEIDPRRRIGYATEGISVKDFKIGTSYGVPNTEVVIPERGVFFGTVSVTTIESGQRVPWSYVSDLSLARPTQAVFTTFIDENEVTHIVFGDNAAGRIPTTNADIYATYRYGVGVEANSLAVGDIDTIIPKTGVEIGFVSVTNESSPLGGSDPETIESMKYNIPRGTRIKHRAVTLNDYADLAVQVPGVAKSVSYGTVYTAVHVKIAPQGGTATDEHMQRLCVAVEDYMKDKILIGSSVYVGPNDADELWHDIYIRLLLHVIEGFNRTTVREQVETVVRRLLEFNAVDFGTRISVGSIYRAVLSVHGVEWAELQWLSTNEPPDEIGGGPTMELIPPEASQWKASANTTIADPTAGYIRINATNTVIAFSQVNQSVINVGAALLNMEIGDQILLRSMKDLDTWQGFILTELPVDNAGTPGWVQFTVTLAEQSPDYTAPILDDPIRFDFYRPNPTPAILQEVYDINTPELFIPRIEPTEVVETVEQFPDMTEAERTHDGLWIQAVGGIPNS